MHKQETLALLDRARELGLQGDPNNPMGAMCDLIEKLGQADPNYQDRVTKWCTWFGNKQVPA